MSSYFSIFPGRYEFNMILSTSSPIFKMRENKNISQAFGLIVIFKIKRNLIWLPVPFMCLGIRRQKL